MSGVLGIAAGRGLLLPLHLGGTGGDPDRAQGEVHWGASARWAPCSESSRSTLVAAAATGNSDVRADRGDLEEPLDHRCGDREVQAARSLRRLEDRAGAQAALVLLRHQGRAQAEGDHRGLRGQGSRSWPATWPTTSGKWGTRASAGSRRPRPARSGSSSRSELREARQELDKASLALRKFQEIHKIIDLPEQAKAVVSAMATLEGDLISKRVQLAYLSGFASRDEATASQLSHQIAILRKELATLEEQRAPAVARAATNDRGQRSLSGRHGRSRASLRAGGAVSRAEDPRDGLLLLTERYESLKVNEARDLSTFVVFDRAALPTRSVRPRLRVLPIGMMVGLVLGFMFIALPPWWRDLKRRAAVERMP